MLPKELVQLPEIRRELKVKKKKLSTLRTAEGARKSNLNKEIQQLIRRGTGLIDKGKEEFRFNRETIGKTQSEIEELQSRLDNANDQIKEWQREISGYEDDKRQYEEKILILKRKLEELEWENEIVRICLKEETGPVPDLLAGGDQGLQTAQRKKGPAGLFIALSILVILIGGIIAANLYLGSLAAGEIEGKILRQVKAQLQPLSFNYTDLSVNPLLARLAFRNCTLTSALEADLIFHCDRITLAGAHRDFLPLIRGRSVKTLSALNIGLKKGRLLRPGSASLLSLGNFSFKYRGLISERLLSEISPGNFQSIIKESGGRLLIKDLKIGPTEELSSFLLGLGIETKTIEVDRFSSSFTLEGGRLVLSGTELVSSLLRAALELEIDIDQAKPERSEIIWGKLLISDISSQLAGAMDLIEQSSPFTLPRKEGTISIKFSGPISNPQITDISGF